MNKASRSVVVLLALVGVAAVLGAAGSAASTRSAPQRFVLYSANINSKDAPMLVQATGPITAIGSAVANDDAPGNSVPLTFTFPKGKLFLKARDNFNWKPDLASCTATESSAGTFIITGGTGSYRGMTSHGTYVEHGAAIGARDAHGRCLQKFKLNYVTATLLGR
jgi:hypothetical protein